MGQKYAIIFLIKIFNRMKKISSKSVKRFKISHFWGPSSGETIVFTGSTYMPKDSPTLKLVVYQVSSKSLEPFLVGPKLLDCGQNSHTEPSGTYTGAHARCFPKRNFFFKSFLFTSFKKRLKKQISQIIITLGWHLKGRHGWEICFSIFSWMQ